MTERPLTHRFTGSTRVDLGLWDPDRETITVHFPDGAAWTYEDCPAKVWDDFRDAASPGRFLHDELDRHSRRPA